MIPGFYTTAEIMARFNWQRAQVSATAKREKWEFLKVGTSKLWRALDVDDYALARTRTELQQQLGWQPAVGAKQLLRADDADFICPVCGGFAVELWPPLEGKRPWRCVNGHGEKA